MLAGMIVCKHAAHKATQMANDYQKCLYKQRADENERSQLLRNTIQHEQSQAQALKHALRADHRRGVIHNSQKWHRTGH